MTGRVIRFPARPMSTADGQAAADRILAVPASERIARSSEFSLDDPETLLLLCGRLRQLLESKPLSVRDDAESLYRFLAEPKRPVGLFDEREYFLGELALLVGTATRMLALRDEACRWFDRAEANFRLTVNAVADWSRVAYQRLAMLLEKRQFDELLEDLPDLVNSFAKLDMAEDILKCRSLEGLSLMEMGELSRAGIVFESVRQEARRLGHERLVASAGVNLVHVFSQLGASEEALACAREVLPLLRKLDHRVAIAQVQAGIGSLLRARRQLTAALDAYESARAEYGELGMLADVAAMRLVIADLLMATGQEPLAVQEILTALPIIEEYKMVPEGKAALALLRESVREKRVDHQALRDLHGFFEDSVS